MSISDSYIGKAFRSLGTSTFEDNFDIKDLARASPAQYLRLTLLFPLQLHPTRAERIHREFSPETKHVQAGEFVLWTFDYADHGAAGKNQRLRAHVLETTGKGVFVTGHPQSGWQSQLWRTREKNVIRDLAFVLGWPAFAGFAPVPNELVAKYTSEGIKDDDYFAWGMKDNEPTLFKLTDPPEAAYVIPPALANKRAKPLATVENDTPLPHKELILREVTLFGGGEVDWFDKKPRELRTDIKNSRAINFALRLDVAGNGAKTIFEELDGDFEAISERAKESWTRRSKDYRPVRLWPDPERGHKQHWKDFEDFVGNNLLDVSLSAGSVGGSEPELAARSIEVLLKPLPFVPDYDLVELVEHDGSRRRRTAWLWCREASKAISVNGDTKRLLPLDGSSDPMNVLLQHYSKTGELLLDGDPGAELIEFFCSYLTAEEGLFVVVRDTDDLRWRGLSHQMQTTIKKEGLVFPTREWPPFGQGWEKRPFADRLKKIKYEGAPIYEVCVVYNEVLFHNLLTVGATGTVDMLKDVAIVPLQDQRSYRMDHKSWFFTRRFPEAL